jgi:hypothetical protein
MTQPRLAGANLTAGVMVGVAAWPVRASRGLHGAVCGAVQGCAPCCGPRKAEEGSSDTGSVWKQKWKAMLVRRHGHGQAARGSARDAPALSSS